MRTIKSIPIIYFLALLLFLATPAIAKASSCYVEANNTDVFVKVYDGERYDGSRNRIWMGRLDDGESVRLNTSGGRLTYYYTTKPDEDGPLKGGLERLCDNERTIAVP
jgi:hypothetical protein